MENDDVKEELTMELATRFTDWGGKNMDRSILDKLKAGNIVRINTNWGGFYATITKVESENIYGMLSDPYYLSGNFKSPWLSHLHNGDKVVFRKENIFELPDWDQNYNLFGNAHPVRESKLQDDEQSRQVHPNICDECRNWIVGILYYCPICCHYDICEKCMAKDNVKDKHANHGVYPKYKGEYLLTNLRIPTPPAMMIKKVHYNDCCGEECACSVCNKIVNGRTLYMCLTCKNKPMWCEECILVDNHTKGHLIVECYHELCMKDYKRNGWKNLKQAIEEKMIDKMPSDEILEEIRKKEALKALKPKKVKPNQVGIIDRLVDKMPTDENGNINLSNLQPGVICSL